MFGVGFCEIYEKFVRISGVVEMNKLYLYICLNISFSYPFFRKSVFIVFIVTKIRASQVTHFQTHLT